MTDKFVMLQRIYDDLYEVHGELFVREDAIEALYTERHQASGTMQWYVSMDSREHWQITKACFNRLKTHLLIS